MKIIRSLQIGMFASVLLLTGCASIVSKSNWPVNFKSDPPGAQVVITDEYGNEVDRGTTPQVFTLHASDGYFQSATYYADFQLNGYQESKRGIHANINGWYFGNILLGGLVGGLIVDPVTGAMWKLPPLVTVNLEKQQSATGTVPIATQSKTDVH